MLACSPSVNLNNLNTSIPADAPAAQPIEFTIHKSLDSVLEGSPSVNLNTSSSANTLIVQQSELLGSRLVNENQAIEYNMPVADQVGLMGASITHDPVDIDNQETVRASPI